MSLLWICGRRVTSGSTVEAIAGNQAAAPAPALRFVMVKAGTVQRLSMNIPTNTLDGALVVTVLKNGVATGMSVSYAGGEVGIKFAAGPAVGVVQGDTISFELDTTAATVGSAFYAGSVDTPVPHLWNTATLSIGTVWEGSFATVNTAAPQINVRAPMGRAYTLRNFTVRIAANAKAAPVPMHVRKNGVITAMAVVIPAGTTGLFTSDPGGITVVDTDLVSIGGDGTGSPSVTFDYQAAVELVP